MGSNKNCSNKLPGQPTIGSTSLTVRAKGMSNSRDIKGTGSAGFGGSKAIDFGSPSDKGQTHSLQSTGTTWGSLFKSTASGGVSSALGGGLGSVLGIGGIVSGFMSLFGGGKDTPTPLQRFSLSASKNGTVYVGNGSSAVYQGVSEVGVAGHASSGGIYRTTDIAQAVKTALLNSSSLNDVITEL